MTILLEIDKHYGKGAATALNDTSAASDGGLGNFLISTISFGKLGRDPILGSDKRAEVLNFIVELSNMVDCENDEATHQALVKMLKDTKKATKLAGEKKGYREANTEAGLTEAVCLLEDIYSKLKDFKLTDIQHDTDPFNIFRCCAAWYLANRVVAAKNPGLLDRLLANPNVGGSQIVMLEKEAILHKALNNCSESLLELERLNAGKSKDDRDYQNARRKAVIAELKELRTQNKEVCEKHKVNVQMPIVRVMFFSASCQIPLFGHKIGTLEDCIAEALKAMGGETKPEESHESEYGHSEPASSVH